MKCNTYQERSNNSKVPWLFIDWYYSYYVGVQDLIGFAVCAWMNLIRIDIGAVCVFEYSVDF